MQRESIIEADLTFVDGAFEPNVQVAVGDNGIIEQVGYLDRKPTIRLVDRALLPGMVNAHSCAFQRGLRGFAEQRGAYLDWRRAMYDLVECLEVEEFSNLCRMAFEEMLHHGITTVGEFHFLHHDRSESGFGLDEALLEAACDAGIRLVLVCCFFGRGGIGGQLLPAQRRFLCGDVDTFCSHVDLLRNRFAGTPHRLGVGAYDLCTVTPDELARLAAFASERQMPLHVNAERLQSEVDDCRAVYGGSPVEIMLDRNLLNPGVTLVHCSRTEENTLRAAAKAGARFCLCPTTEANLGTHFARIPVLIEENARVCLGTDTNVRISMNEEMRWLEYAERIRSESRGVCAREKRSFADTVWRFATLGGANALGIKAGTIATGHNADFLAIDTKGLSLLGATRESLLTAFVTGADRAAVTHTCVAGRWRTWND